MVAPGALSSSSSDLFGSISSCKRDQRSVAHKKRQIQKSEAPNPFGQSFIKAYLALDAYIVHHLTILVEEGCNKELVPEGCAAAAKKEK
jgi:hypothetical protein